MIDRIVDAVVGLIEILGAPGVGIAVALENLFPPIPSEVILPAAGFAAHSGKIGLIEAIIYATIGSVVGALALYGIGRSLGRERFDALAARIPFVNREDLDRTHAWMHRFGNIAVLIGRLVPIIRSLVSIPAGIERMPVVQFTLLTTIGAGVWNTLLVGVGYYLGSRWTEVEVWIERYQLLVIIIAVILIAVWLGMKIRRYMAERAAKSNEVV